MSKISKIEKRIRERIIEIEKEIKYHSDKANTLLAEFESLKAILKDEVVDVPD